MNFLNKGILTKNFAGTGPVTREMVHLRALELAAIAARASSSHVVQADYEQAKRELTGESDLERQEAILKRPRAKEAPMDRESGMRAPSRDR